MKLLFSTALISVLLATTSAFAFLGSTLKKQTLVYSTLDDAVENAAQPQKSRPADDAWVSQQLNSMDQIELPGAVDPMHREHDWFSEALHEGPDLLKGLGAGKDSSPIHPKSVYHGLRPVVPPAAPSFQSLQAYHLEPVDLSEKATPSIFREHDWFGAVLNQDPMSLEGLQIKAGKSPIAVSMDAGIVPDVPRMAPSLESLESFCLGPKGNANPTAGKSPLAMSMDAGIIPDVPRMAPSLASLDSFCLEPKGNANPTGSVGVSRELVEWFSHANKGCKQASTLVDHNQVNHGSGEWFMQALA
ncbi:expressed unknown protein [Seminavis robusta]|uniref:Uncharacterized protein n=1 Tax=Seminavis robusta TaxID=568900 RepID=A0A9N8EUS7_9STRA|nr:expressed unknown protein [Seminavis robusta]|eukprot:Sro2261_g321160.1 n/a (302) ;mRNA; r:6239-7144